VYSVSGAGGVLPTSSAATYTRITTNTVTSVIYPASESRPDSFVFERATSKLWLTDASSNATYWGVWQFPWNSTSQLHEPTSSLDRVWSTANCLGITGQPQAGTFTLYFACGSATASAVYRMPVGGSPPYTATTVAQAPTNSYYRGVCFVPGTTASASQSSTPSPTASPTPTQSQRAAFNCSLYSGSGAFRDPCCRGLAFMYPFGTIAGDSVQTKAANGHFTKNLGTPAFKLFGVGA